MRAQPWGPSASAGMLSKDRDKHITRKGKMQAKAWCLDSELGQTVSTFHQDTRFGLFLKKWIRMSLKMILEEFLQ